VKRNHHLTWVVVLSVSSGACFGIGLSEWLGNALPWFMLLLIPGTVLLATLSRRLMRSRDAERELVLAVLGELADAAAHVPPPGSCTLSGQGGD
jgi:membrane protein implicated in regulation of membrane protease activity